MLRLLSTWVFLGLTDVARQETKLPAVKDAAQKARDLRHIADTKPTRSNPDD